MLGFIDLEVKKYITSFLNCFRIVNGSLKDVKHGIFFIIDPQNFFVWLAGHHFEKILRYICFLELGVGNLKREFYYKQQDRQFCIFLMEVESSWVITESLSYPFSLVLWNRARSMCRLRFRCSMEILGRLIESLIAMK